MSSRVGRSTALYFGTQVVSTVTGFAATWYINLALGPGAYGTYSLAMGLLFWLTVPASAVGNATNKRVSEGEDRGAVLAAGHLLNLAAFAVVCGGLLLVGRQVDIFVGAEVALVLTGAVFARAVFRLTVSSLRGHKQVGTSGAVKTVERTVRSVVQIGGIYLLGLGVVWLVSSALVALVVATAAGLVVLDGTVARPTREHFRAVVDYAKYAWSSVVQTRAFAWTDIVVMRALSLNVVGLAAVTKVQIGIYGVSWTTASVLALASLAIEQTLFPEISELATEGRDERVRHFLDEALAFSGVFLVPGVVGAALVGDTLLTVFGAEYARGGTILVVLVGARLVAAYGDQFVSVLGAVDRPDLMFRVNVVYVLANVALNLLLVSAFGWYGAATATLLTAVVGLSVSATVVADVVGLPSFPAATVGAQVVAAAVMGAAVYGLRLVLPGTLAWTIALVGAGGVLYGAVLLALSARVRTKALSLVPV